MFSYGDKMKSAKVKVGGIMQNIERKRARFKEKYSQVCITRVAVNENVCEDSHTVDCKCSGSTSWLVDNTITHQ